MIGKDIKSRRSWCEACCCFDLENFANIFLQNPKELPYEGSNGIVAIYSSTGKEFAAALDKWIVKTSDLNAEYKRRKAVGENVHNPISFKQGFIHDLVREYVSGKTEEDQKRAFTITKPMVDAVIKATAPLVELQQQLLAEEKYPTLKEMEPTLKEMKLICIGCHTFGCD